MPLCASRRERQHRVQAVKRLNSRLLIHTEYGSMLGAFQIEPNNVGRLLLETRVLARHVAVEPMRLDSGLPARFAAQSIWLSRVLPPVCGKSSGCFRRNAVAESCGGPALATPASLFVAHCSYAGDPNPQCLPVRSAASNGRLSAGRCSIPSRSASSFYRRLTPGSGELGRHRLPATFLTAPNRLALGAARGLDPALADSVAQSHDATQQAMVTKSLGRVH